MTEKNTSAFQESELLSHADDAPNPSADLPQGDGIGTLSAAARTRSVLTPSEWRKVAFLSDMGVESLLQEFATVDDCETWLWWLERDIAKALPDSIRERLRAHVESLLLEYRSRPTERLDLSTETGNDTRSKRLQSSEQTEPNSSDSPVQQTASHTAQEAHHAIKDVAPPARAGGAVSPEPPDRFRSTEPWWVGWGYVPNALLRCSLFAALRTSSRKLKNEQVESLSNINITVTGPQLTQPDLDVWMVAVYLARHGDVVRINRRAFLERLERATGSSDREWLTKALIRLRECHIDVSLDGHRRFAGHLLSSLTIQKRSGDASDVSRAELELEVDPSMAIMFHDGWTRIELSARAELRGDPLANWLLGFYSTHKKPKDLKIETLQRLSGAGGSGPVFRQRLAHALLTLESGGYVDKAVIAQGKVFVTRTTQPTDGERQFGDQGPQRLRRSADHMPKRLSNRKRRSQPVVQTVWQRIGRLFLRLRVMWDPLS